MVEALRRSVSPGCLQVWRANTVLDSDHDEMIQLGFYIPDEPGQAVVLQFRTSTSIWSVSTHSLLLRWITKHTYWSCNKPLMPPGSLQLAVFLQELQGMRGSFFFPSYKHPVIPGSTSVKAMKSCYQNHEKPHADIFQWSNGCQFFGLVYREN